MDSKDGLSLSIPRLRLARHSSPSAYLDDRTPVAGPSRISPRSLSIPTFNGDDDDGSSQSTPRLPFAPRSLINDQSAPSFLPSSPGETPAARLRAVLARLPASHDGSSQRLQPTARYPGTPSDIDSDFDVPNSMSVAPSFAQESLKELFSRALLDTPQKGRRRNSFDSSVADISPRKERVARERVKGKGKRQSLSDDDLEVLSTLHSESQDHTPDFATTTSPKTSPAATYHSLRERLNNSQVRISDPQAPTPRQRTSCAC
jgi:serine/arginine repetitive matrix protein 2